jgi:hypothetical protein
LRLAVVAEFDASLGSRLDVNGGVKAGQRGGGKPGKFSLERPCSRSDENLGHISSLVGVVVIARKLTYGNFVASNCRNQKYEAISGGFVAALPGHL